MAKPKTDATADNLTDTAPEPRPITDYRLKLQRGQAGCFIPVEQYGHPGKRKTGKLVPGETYPIVPDDSEAEGWGATIAQELVDKGICTLELIVIDEAVIVDSAATPPAE